MALMAALFLLLVGSAAAFAPVSRAPPTTHLHQNTNTKPSGNIISLQFDKEATTKADLKLSNNVQLGKTLNKGDIERCKIAEEADRWERAAEILRKERL